MPDLLRFVVYSPDMLDEVRDFRYGDEPHQQELADWLRNDSVAAMERGTKVWLYVNQAGDVIGYGSLGPTRWKYPDPAAQKVELLIIPAVAIRQEFWGKPDGDDRDQRYSSQIMRHLLDEAREWPGSIPALGLFVHPDNRSAIKLYERFQFQTFHHTYTDATTGVRYISYVRPIIRG